MTLKGCLKGLADPEHDFGIDDGIDHNEFQHMDGHTMQGEFHCWLYHFLYDHTDLCFDGCNSHIDEVLYLHLLNAITL